MPASAKKHKELIKKIDISLNIQVKK